MAYTSKYSGAEIDQRLLQNYYDDLVAAGYSGTKAEYLSAIRSLLQFDKANISAGNVKYRDDKSNTNTTVQAKLDEIVNKVIEIASTVSTTPQAGTLNKNKLRTRADVATMAAQDMSGKSFSRYYLKKRDLPSCGILDLSHPRGGGENGTEPVPDSYLVTYNTVAEAIKAVPSQYRRGGLEIKFVLRGSDTYKFMRLVKAHWSINQNYWKKC